MLCERCTYYEPVSFSILIIKLDSMGDVLRTTSVLPPLKEQYPASSITWVTRQESIDLLSGNPLIDEILEFESNTLSRILAREYDLILGLDVTKDSASLCSIARGNEKLGFSLDASGALSPLNESAQEWFLMGLNDELKKLNKKSYQHILHEICNLPLHTLYPPQLYLSEHDNRFGQEVITSKGLDFTRPIIGVNTGSGSRWRLKSLPLESLVNLINCLKKTYQVTLLGGPNETERNETLVRFTGAIDTGCNNTLRQFASIVNQCSLVVTGDTLTLHIALALKKKIITFFGPTSSQEIDLFSRGIKFSAPLECLCCYLPFCEKNPNCMDLLNINEIVSNAERILSQP